MEQVEKFKQMVDEAYKAYFSKTENITLETLHVPYQNTHLYGTISGAISNAKFRPYTKEEFINKCKTDLDFSQKWGLTIEERELSLEERKTIYENEYAESMEVPNNHWLNSKLTTRNIPTKVTTITYKDNKIETYG
jgi:hypothetical protein